MVIAFTQHFQSIYFNILVANTMESFAVEKLAPHLMKSVGWSTPIYNTCISSTFTIFYFEARLLARYKLPCLTMHFYYPVSAARFEDDVISAPSTTRLQLLHLYSAWCCHYLTCHCFRRKLQATLSADPTIGLYCCSCLGFHKSPCLLILPLNNTKLASIILSANRYSCGKYFFL